MAALEAVRLPAPLVVRTPALGALLFLAALAPLAAAVPPLPDLSVAGLAWSPGHPVEGDAVTFEAVVLNEGDADAGAFEVAFFVDGELVGNVSVDGLAAAANVTVVAPPWMSDEGEHTVRVVADAGQAVVEADELDNDLAEDFTVAPPPIPDLVLVALAPGDDDPIDGAALAFVARIENHGTGDADSFLVGFAVDGAALGNVSVDGLAAGAGINVTSATWTAVEGDHAVQAVADLAHEVDEASEENNDRTEPFNVGPLPLPDLRVPDILLSPAAPIDGQASAFTAVVENHGEVAAGPFLVGFAVDGVLLGNVSVDGLDAHATVNVTSPAWTAAHGGHSVRAAADVADQVEEDDEGNNERLESFTVGPGLPDLVVRALTRSPAEPRPGEVVTFTATVANEGTGPAGAFDVDLVLDGALLGSQRLDGLAAGASADVVRTWTATRGEHALRAVADAREEVAESSEENNDRRVAFHVPAARVAGDDDKPAADRETVAICHIPPGNPRAAHTLRVGAPAVAAHLAHGDHEGTCDGSEATVLESHDHGPDDGAAGDREHGPPSHAASVQAGGPHAGEVPSASGHAGAQGPPAHASASAHAAASATVHAFNLGGATLTPASVVPLVAAAVGAALGGVGLGALRARGRR